MLASSRVDSAVTPATKRYEADTAKDAVNLQLADINRDGHLDIFKTHFRGDTNALYRNNGKGYFRDVTIRAGLGVETRYVCWGAGIVDLDNDGLPDLFFTTGMVYPEVERKSPDAAGSTSIGPIGISRTRPLPRTDERQRLSAIR